MYTAPLATAGEDSPISPVLYLQRTVPVCRSNATSSPPAEPTYTVPSAIAAEDSMASPASKVQSTFKDAGSVDDETPVSGGLPRNCGQAASWACRVGLKSARTTSADITISCIKARIGRSPWRLQHQTVAG